MIRASERVEPASTPPPSCQASPAPWPAPACSSFSSTSWDSGGWRVSTRMWRTRLVPFLLKAVTVAVYAAPASSSWMITSGCEVGGGGVEVDFKGTVA